MLESQDSDAAILWEDVMALLAARGDLNQSIIAMIDSCAPVSMDDETFHISTPLGFVQRKITQNAAAVEECLEQASFTHLRLVVDLVKDARPVRVASEVSPEELTHLTQVTSAPVPQRAAVVAPPAPQVVAAIPHARAGSPLGLAYDETEAKNFQVT